VNRVLTFLAASACAALAVSSACFAADWSALPFRLAKTMDAGRIQLSIQNQQGSHRSGNWSQTFTLAELQGLNATQLVAKNSTPIRFALVRPAGRFDCSGSVRSYDGRGSCTYAADAAFSAMLARRGLGQPSLDQSFALAMSDFRSEILDALAAAGYPRPTLDQSVALGIFKIAPSYVLCFADTGYRLGSVDNLIAFKIFKITPDYIASFVRLGYRDLPAEKLVQLKIFGVTPADVRALQAQGIATPSAEQLVRERLAGFGPTGRRRGD